LSKYSRLLLSLLPDGPPWPKGERALSNEVAELFADALTPKVERLDSVIKNIDPRTAETWLSGWENALGLTQGRASLEDRQKRAYAAYVKTTDISLAALKERIKREIGVEAIIDESFPIGAGEISAGDELEAESTAFVATVRNVPMSEKLFQILKEFWQAHTLFVVDTGDELIPIRGAYAED